MPDVLVCFDLESICLLILSFTLVEHASGPFLLCYTTAIYAGEADRGPDGITKCCCEERHARDLCDKHQRGCRGISGYIEAILAVCVCRTTTVPHNWQVFLRLDPRLHSTWLLHFH